LYGTTLYLGSSGVGSVFKIATDGTAYTTLHSFTPGVTGYAPYTAPIQGIDGNFYGTTNYGLANVPGSVYKMTPTGVLTTLHEFSIRGQGAFPSALMQATDGNFYGTTHSGDTGPCGGGVA
jgi:uncharacterized repeat protein (TIGR03803 family)